MKPSKPFLPYHIHPNGRWWDVYKWDNPDKQIGTKIDGGFDKEKAKEVAYRLNGEYFKSKKINS